MGFVKSQEELAKLARAKSEFYDAEMLVVMWETKPQIVKRLLPPPLKHAAKPLATAYVSHYPRTNFGPAYYEAGLFLRAEFGGVPGNYCLAMSVTLDTAMARGRERIGYPKKMAKILFKRSGDRVRGSVERHGVRFFTVSAKLAGKTNTEEFQNIVIGEATGEGTVSYNFKHFQSPNFSDYDYPPRLVRERSIMRPNTAEWGEAKVTLSHSDHDPWSEVEIVRVLGSVYTVGNNTEFPGEVIAEADAATFAPYGFLKWDYWPSV
jgi:acetoacetate decarboxylase